MAEEETKICANCKRDIPLVNFLVHTVHCARNIRVCPTCKEPVPHTDLEEHHEKLHKLQPCKKCGERICGSDMEDHIRDSCAHTIMPCRFCELELPRKELPLHEGYCGSRTEQCPECREYVMIKYRQLHLDSNHGFLKLDDEPTPVPSPSRSFASFVSPKPVSSKSLNEISSNGFQKTNNLKNNSESKYLIPVPNTSSNIPERPRSNGDGPSSSSDRPSSTSSSSSSSSDQFSLFGLPTSRSYHGLRTDVLPGPSGQPIRKEGRVAKRTNDRPQINTLVEAMDKINRDSTVTSTSSGGAIKKRMAPKAPLPLASTPAASAAAQRQQDEAKEREMVNARNLELGLPPVLNPAEKLERLRKMDALHNRETESKDYKNVLQGRCWKSPEVPTGNVLGAQGSSQKNLAIERRKELKELKDLKPMTHAEFLQRFQKLQADSNDRAGGYYDDNNAGIANGDVRQDRFNEIKSSLRELRRGLNEVTAPYNANAGYAGNENATGSNKSRKKNRNKARSPAAAAAAVADDDEVRIPCEFCSVLVPIDDLVQHQTGCRPDLTQYGGEARAASPSPLLSPLVTSNSFPDPYENPVIPCEFCTESLPVYLITEHQERCRSGPQRLFPN